MVILKNVFGQPRRDMNGSRYIHSLITIQNWHYFQHLTCPGHVEAIESNWASMIGDVLLVFWCIYFAPTGIKGDTESQIELKPQGVEAYYVLPQ